MIEVDEIELKIILPDDGIGMVIMQPFVELGEHEPYRWEGDKKNKQIDRIIRTLEIAKQASHGCEKTHFTIFPEYAIPGLEGIRKIQEVLENSAWKDGTIVIGGVDGLNKNEYTTLCSEINTKVHQKNKPNKVLNNQWVNCFITWTKETDGSLTRWIQPKMVPATQEELCPAYHMFEGRAAYFFRPKISIQGLGLPFRFLSFICKDWIGNVGGSNAVDVVLSEIDRKRGSTDRLDIYLCFIIKRNPYPDYPLFLQKTIQYLNENTNIAIRRSDGVVLFVNNAGKNGPGYCENFGKSGFVFHPNSSFVSHEKYCPPTYSLKTREGLSTCKEARFRERGACILSFKFLPPIPAIVSRIPVTPMIPLNPAIVHSVDAPIGEIEEDPRTSGNEIPASVKWVNDCLDTIDFVLINEGSHPLRNEIKDSHDTVCNEIRRKSNEFLCRYITIASCEIENETEKWIKTDGGEIPAHNVDNWDENEQKALETIVASLSIMKVCKSLEVNNSYLHATIKILDKVIDVIVVSGKTHEGCFKYATDNYTRSKNFVIVVTNNGKSSLLERPRDSIYDVKFDSSRGPHIANPPSRFYHCGYQDLINSCFHSQNIEELNDEVTRIMGV